MNDANHFKRLLNSQVDLYNEMPCCSNLLFIVIKKKQIKKQHKVCTQQNHLNDLTDFLQIFKSSEVKQVLKIYFIPQ